jgi:hypothetical protein
MAKPNGLADPPFPTPVLVNPLPKDLTIRIKFSGFPEKPTGWPPQKWDSGRWNNPFFRGERSIVSAVFDRIFGLSYRQPPTCEADHERLARAFLAPSEAIQPVKYHAQQNRGGDLGSPYP